jgi:hypothetical protein
MVSFVFFFFRVVFFPRCGKKTDARRAAGSGRGAVPRWTVPKKALRGGAEEGQAHAERATDYFLAPFWPSCAPRALLLWLKKKVGAFSIRKDTWAPSKKE